LAKELAVKTSEPVFTSDIETVQNALFALRDTANIDSACIYNKDGHIVSRYPRSRQDTDFPSDPWFVRHYYEETDLVMLQPILRGEERVGTVCIKANYEARHARAPAEFAKARSK